MIHRLLERLERPVTVIVGKGGVGKTTTAGGIALALADEGTSTHLISTDPAHSLADLFGTPAADRPVARCTDHLTLEELDARRVAGEFLGSLEPALEELLDRGTYLDADDTRSLLAGSLPGLDEIGAALRLADLADTGRLVVDTAPTGHTLRLLAVPDTISGFVLVFRAMAAKADTVASALVGQAVRLTGEDALDALEDQARRFRALIDGADFVVVTASGEVVRAETKRLREALTSSGLRIAATVAVDRGDARADVLLPAREGLQGCEALRAWIGVQDPGGAAGDEGALRAAGPPPSRASDPAGSRANRPGGILPLLERDLLVFAGKGGVGKSTAAAAAAVRLAELGPVTLVGADPAGSLAEVLPDPPPGLEVQEIDAAGALERFRVRYTAEVERAFEAVGLDRAAQMDREVVESLWGLAPPGLDEVVSIARLASGDEGARIVLDTAPTGHFLRLMAMPDLARDWVLRLMRILLKYHALGGLDAPAEDLVRFARRLRALQERLSDSSRTGIVLVTLDEALVSSETRRLAAALHEAGRQVTAVLVNRAEDGTRAFDTGPAGPGRAAPPVLVAPRVEEPIGRDRLRSFFDGWQPLR